MIYELLTSFVFLLIGIVLLYYGADWIVKSGVHIASQFQIPHFVIGLTLVAFGTSLPELVVSLKAALDGYSGIAIGNIVGSNIANVGLVLGISSTIFPIFIQFKLIKREIGIYFIVCCILVLFMLDYRISQWEGLVLFLGIIVYTFWCIKSPVEEPKEVSDQLHSTFGTWILLVLGIIVLYLGSKSFVKGAIDLAHIFKVDEIVIGMSIVAFGTSLPELATSVVAAFRRESAISMGNIIGSNLFNILSVLGLVSIIKPIDISSGILTFEIPVMILFGLVLIPLSFMRQPVSRTSSVLLFIGYVIFLFNLNW